MGDAVRLARKEAGLTQAQVEEETQAIGARIPQAVLANIESGRRTDLRVREWLILAAVLDVAPIDLLPDALDVVDVFPLEVTGGREMTGQDLRDWIVGEADLNRRGNEWDAEEWALLKARHALDRALHLRGMRQADVDHATEWLEREGRA